MARKDSPPRVRPWFVRPRRGTALERLALYAQELGISAANIVHAWAEKNEDEITKRIKEEAK